MFSLLCNLFSLELSVTGIEIHFIFLERLVFFFERFNTVLVLLDLTLQVLNCSLRTSYLLNLVYLGSFRRLTRHRRAGPKLASISSIYLWRFTLNRYLSGLSGLSGFKFSGHATEAVSAVLKVFFNLMSLKLIGCPFITVRPPKLILLTKFMPIIRQNIRVGCKLAPQCCDENPFQLISLRGFSLAFLHRFLLRNWNVFLTVCVWA